MGLKGSLNNREGGRGGKREGIRIEGQLFGLGRKKGIPGRQTKRNNRGKGRIYQQKRKGGET